MINYNLRCHNGHEFDSWFQHSQAFETLQANQLIACPICDSKQIVRGLNCPNIAPNLNDTTAKNAREYAKQMRQKILNEFLNAGDNFADMARQYHQQWQNDGTALHQGLYGTIQLDEAVELHEEGIDIIPLPKNFLEPEN